MVRERFFLRVRIRGNLGGYLERTRVRRLESRTFPADGTNGILPPQLGQCMPALEAERRATKLAALRAQIIALSRQRRSSSEFRPWRPDMFYYLFSGAASVLVPWMAGIATVGLSLRAMVTTALCLGLFCYVPVLANRVRFWLGFRRPNRQLRRRIAMLQAEVERLQGPP